MRLKREHAEKLRVDLPTLQAIAARTWGKEDELKALKTELATLDQKITAELAPKQEKQDFGEEVKRDQALTQVKSDEAPAQSIGSKESMVAEPKIPYTINIPQNRVYNGYHL